MRSCLSDGNSFVRGGVLVLLILTAGTVVCGEQGTGAETLFADPQFRRGFLLSHADSSKGRAVEAVLNFDDPNNVPAWRLCQWATKYSLATAPCIRGSDGDLSYENEGKQVVIGGPDSRRRDLVLAICGTAEYGAVARRRGEAWPHLLVEQDAIRVRPLDELEEIQFEVDVRLLHCRGHMAGDEYDPSLHAAQFQMFFIVKNIRSTSDDFGDYYWFGVPFYDSRYDVPPAYTARDAGKSDATGKFIYTVAGKAVGVTSLQANRWVRVQSDLLPHVKSGLQEAAERGYLRSTSPHDYAVANMNLGWEIPGTFDAAVQVRGLRIRAILKGSRR